MITISSAVILFNATLCNSDTLNSILNADINNIKLTVNIWNNGPEKLEEKDVRVFLDKANNKHIIVNIYEDCRNIALSKIYNFFIKKNDYDFISILDQDSQLQSDFYTNIASNKHYAVVCPAVNIKSTPLEQECPIYLGILDAKVEPSSSFIASDIVTISSGLSLSSLFVKNVEEKYDTVFNENFAFYYTDLELFLARLKKCQKMEGICVGKMIHDLTGKVEIKDMSPRVKLERGYGKILNKYYISEKANKSQSSMLVYTIKQIIKDKYPLKDAISLLKCAITKKHPRCKYNIDANKLSDYTNN